MNDMTNDLTPEERDELASAYLDGEATAEEQAMVEADSDLLARVEQLRHAAQEVASPAAEAGREEIIAEAMKAFKPQVEPAEQPEKLKGRQLRSRQKEARSGFLLELRERLRNRRLVPVLGAAAALAVVFLAITFFALTSEDTGDDSDAASFATDSPATTFEFVPLLESADFPADEALADAAAAFAPATTAASATTAQAADFAPALAPSGEGRPFTETEQDDMQDETEASLQQADGPSAEARAQLAVPEGGLDAECPEEEPAEDEPAEEEPSVSEPDEAQNSLDAGTLPTTSLNPSSTTTSLPPEEASEEDLSDLNMDIFEDAPLAECP